MHTCMYHQTWNKYLSLTIHNLSHSFSYPKVQSISPGHDLLQEFLDWENNLQCLNDTSNNMWDGELPFLPLVNIDDPLL